MRKIDEREFKRLERFKQFKRFELTRDKKG
jgi:hypothetical protein